MKKILLLLCFVAFFSQSFATVSYLSKNRVTKELFCFETGRIVEYDGLFWEFVAGEEKDWENQENKLKKDGYKYTSFPYKTEIIIIFFVVIIIIMRFRGKYLQSRTRE